MNTYLQITTVGYFITKAENATELIGKELQTEDMLVSVGTKQELQAYLTEHGYKTITPVSLNTNFIQTFILKK